MAGDKGPLLAALLGRLRDIPAVDLVTGTLNEAVVVVGQDEVSVVVVPFFVSSV